MPSDRYRLRRKLVLRIFLTNILFILSAFTAMTTAFNACATLAELREAAAERRKTSRMHKSRLDRFGFEILSLRSEGARASEIQLWLRTHCRTRVALSTVTRWLDKHA